MIIMRIVLKKVLSCLFFLFLVLFVSTLFGSCQKEENENKYEESREQVKSSIQFPMLAWIGLPPKSSVDDYKTMKAAGFTYDLLTYYRNIEQVKEALDKAQSVGIKCIVNCPELGNNPQMVIDKLKTHPAVAGWFVKDEPKRGDLSAVAKKMKSFHSFDSKGISYVNLLPTDSPIDLIGNPPIKYFNDATAMLPLQVLSFTFYPIVVHDGKPERKVNGLWYENLELFAAKAKSLNIPLWTFVLASSYHHPTGKGSYPEPTLGDLRLQIYSNLAYGSQMLQYYTYTTPQETPYYNAPIKKDGTKSATYDKLREVNNEVIRLSGVFVGAKMINVWHTGPQRPKGTKPLVLPKNFGLIKTDGDGAVVSLLKNGKRNYLMIVNHSPTKKMNLEIKATSIVKEVDKNAYLNVVNWDKSRTCLLEPGGMKLYSWE